MILLRIRKRRSSFDEQDFEDTYIAEFCNQQTGQPDQHLSVFFVEDTAPVTIQVQAEYAASLKNDPPRNFTGIDLAGIGGHTILETDGAMRFVFTTKAHRELEFATGSAVREFAAAVCQQVALRRRESTPPDVKAYVLSKYDSGDVEWTTVCESKPKWAKWINRAQKP